MSAIALNRTFEFNPESGQKHENPAKIPRKLLSAPNSPSTAQDEFKFIDSCLPDAAKRNRDCQTNHADDLWAHNPEVAGSNPVPATKRNSRSEAASKNLLGRLLAFRDPVDYRSDYANQLGGTERSRHI
jgi:hypothetical protein